MAEPELRIEEVEKEDALGPASEDESGPTVAAAEFDGTAGFQAAEDADESLVEAALAGPAGSCEPVRVG